jgi:hypothetical protein
MRKMKMNNKYTFTCLEADGLETTVTFKISEDATWDGIVGKFKRFLEAVGYVFGDFTKLTIVDEKLHTAQPPLSFGECEADVYDPYREIDDNVYDSDGNLTDDEYEDDEIVTEDDEIVTEDQVLVEPNTEGNAVSYRWPFI